jgi:hypothetical protein
LDHPEKGCFSGSVTADKANTAIRREGDAGMIEQQAGAKAVSHIIDMEHTKAFAASKTIVQATVSGILYE